MRIGFLLLFFALSLGIISQAQISISAEAELRAIADNLNGNYVLTNDITD